MSGNREQIVLKVAPYGFNLLSAHADTSDMSAKIFTNLIFLPFENN